jgi:hypothetical protein
LNQKKSKENKQLPTGLHQILLLTMDADFLLALRDSTSKSSNDLMTLITMHS